MQTPFQYAKQMMQAEKFPTMTIVAGENGTFWLHDADWKMLDGKAYLSKDAAMKHRSQIIDRARRAVH